MERIIKIILLITIMMASITLFFVLLKVILPKLFLKIEYSVENCLGRGVKKYTYPNGRAVLYEPHPKYRKFVNKYMLFTSDGYKYLKCCLDKGVKNIKLSVVMFDNRGRALDSIVVTCEMQDGLETQAILLHQSTSYVSLQVDNVNNVNLENDTVKRCSLKNVILYSIFVALTFFAGIAVFNILSEDILNYFNVTFLNFEMTFGSVFGWSLLVAILIFIRTIKSAKKRDIKVVKNARK